MKKNILALILILVLTGCQTSSNDIGKDYLDDYFGFEPSTLVINTSDYEYNVDITSEDEMVIKKEYSSEDYLEIDKNGEEITVCDEKGCKEQPNLDVHQYMDFQNTVENMYQIVSNEELIVDESDTTVFYNRNYKGGIETLQVNKEDGSVNYVIEEGENLTKCELIVG